MSSATHSTEETDIPIQTGQAPVHRTSWNNKPIAVFDKALVFCSLYPNEEELYRHPPTRKESGRLGVPDKNVAFVNG